MIDAILSYHSNPQTCGVTKFNIQLAEKMGVPHDALERADQYAHPLISIKASEFTGGTLKPIAARWRPKHFDLLWHDGGPWDVSQTAAQVWYAKDIGCPSTLQGDPTRKGLNVLSFGMAHKFNGPHFQKLKALLDAHGQPYTVSVSSAIHEGSPWDATTKEHVARLRRIFGSHLRWLGFLADDALAREIRDAHTIALFYEPAVRANNTTIWAALEAGTPVVTNLDNDSPPELQHTVSVLDIHQMTEWPDYNGDRQVLRAGGTKAAAVYSWDALLQKLGVSVAV